MARVYLVERVCNAIICTMQARWAIVGGSGIGGLLEGLAGRPVHIPTPLGMQRGREIELGSERVLVVSRHSLGHKTPPHRVNFAAIAWAIRSAGIRHVLATAAVGSLRVDWRPKTLALCTDFIDASGRNLTLFDTRVEHVPFGSPFHEGLNERILEAAGKERLAIEPKAIYVNANGPRYETPAEIEMYRRWGGDVVGMTAGSEAVCMGEAGLSYACLAFVSNLGCGLVEADPNHAEVLEVAHEVGPTILALFQRVIERGSP